MSEEEYEVNIYGGGPFGFRLQGGKEFGRSLAIQSITPGSKSDGKGICPGDILMFINGENTEKMTHLEAQNHIKRSQNLKLHMKRKPGNIAMAAASSSPIVTTEVTHSAKVDYKHNAKPKAFGAPSTTITATTTSPLKSNPPPPPPPPAPVTAPVAAPVAAPVTAPAAVAPRSPYNSKPSSTAIKTAEERKEDTLEDSAVLKMLRSSKLSDESTGLRRMSGGRKVSLDSQEGELPAPPPEAYEDEEEVGPQSRSFRLLEQSIASGDDVPSALRPPVNPPATTRFKGPKPFSSPVNSKPAQSITVKSGSPVAPAYKKTTGGAPSYANPASSYQPPPPSNPPSFQASPPSSYQSSPPPPPAFQPHQPSYPGVPKEPASTYQPPAQRGKEPPTTNKKTASPTCDTCRQVIQGPFVSALGRNWHPEHFKCDGCQRSLQNIGFVEEAGKMFCEECYNKLFAPKCASCHQPIIGVSVKALNKVYHQEHFTCTHCNKLLAGEGFHVENGLPYCSKDYKELFCVKCFSCKQIIRAGDRWMEAVNEKWHVDCFRCMTCGIVLESTGYYTAGNRVFCPSHSQ